MRKNMTMHPTGFKDHVCMLVITVAVTSVQTSSDVGACSGVDLASKFTLSINNDWAY